MKPSVLIGCLFLLYLHMSVPVCCNFTVSHIMITPEEPITGESATLTCQSMGYDPAAHQFVWQKQVMNGSYVNVVAGERIVFGPDLQVFDSVYYQTVTINKLQESDEGTYLCIVIERSNGNQLVNGQGDLYVNYPNEFPVCFPNGPAVVAVGDTLSCKTVIDERIPDVRLSKRPAEEREDWILKNDTESVLELRKYVTVEDEVLMFECFAISNDTAKTLSCIIGPLTVIRGSRSNQATTPGLVQSTPAPLSTMLLSLEAIIGIAVGGSILILLLIIHTICCRCNPKRWCQAESYGIFGASPRKDDAMTGPSGLEMGQNNLGAPPQRGTLGQQPRLSSLEGGDDENSPPIPELEPNIYVDHSIVPGPSSSQFEPDPSENWHEIDLKTQMNEALGDGDSNE